MISKSLKRLICGWFSYNRKITGAVILDWDDSTQKVFLPSEKRLTGTKMIFFFIIAFLLVPLLLYNVHRIHSGCVFASPVEFVSVVVGLAEVAIMSYACLLVQFAMKRRVDLVYLVRQVFMTSEWMESK